MSTETHWHTRRFEVAGIRPDGSPIGIYVWRPATPEHAVNLLSHGLFDMVRLGPPDFDPVAARAAVLAEAHS